MFSPLAFPTGLVLYNLTTAISTSSHLALAPFEQYREPLIVIAIGDSTTSRIGWGDTATNSHNLDGLYGTETDSSTPTNKTALVEDLERIKVQFPKALVHQVLVFDHVAPTVPTQERIFYIPTPEKSKTTTMKTVMCDLTSQLLAEMTLYAKSLQALPSIEFPRFAQSLGNGDRYKMDTLRSSESQQVRRSLSPASTVARVESRMSMPIHISSNTSLRDATPDDRSRSPTKGTSTPPTTFDEIATQEGRRRSRDRVSMQGFGAGGAGERERIKGKGRIAIVIGSLYLLTGRWPDALKELAEGGSIAKANSDYVWHGKALDYIIVCLILYAWAGMEIRVSFPGLATCTSLHKGCF